MVFSHVTQPSPGGCWIVACLGSTSHDVLQPRSRFQRITDSGLGLTLLALATCGCVRTEITKAFSFFPFFAALSVAASGGSLISVGSHGQDRLPIISCVPAPVPPPNRHPPTYSARLTPHPSAHTANYLPSCSQSLNRSSGATMLICL